MRYLCHPANRHDAPMVSPDGACANESEAKTWAELRSPGRGPWSVEPLPHAPKHGVHPPRSVTEAESLMQSIDPATYNTDAGFMRLRFTKEK